MKMNWTTFTLALGTAIMAGMDKITEATTWADVVKPMPVFSMLGAALLTVAAHLLKRPLTKMRERAEHSIRFPGQP